MRTYHENRILCFYSFSKEGSIQVSWLQNGSLLKSVQLLPIKQLILLLHHLSWKHRFIHTGEILKNICVRQYIKFWIISVQVADILKAAEIVKMIYNSGQNFLTLFCCLNIKKLSIPLTFSHGLMILFDNCIISKNMHWNSVKNK